VRQLGRDLGTIKKGFVGEEESKQLADETLGGKFRS
jgi:hypothetical protein